MSKTTVAARTLVMAFGVPPPRKWEPVELPSHFASWIA